LERLGLAEELAYALGDLVADPAQDG